MKRLLPLAIAISVSGCAIYSLVQPGKVEVGNAFRVEPAFEWSRVEVGNVEIWTINGSGLEAVQFIKGVEDGEAPFQSISGPGEKKLQKYRKGMNPVEIQDLMISNLKSLGAVKLDVDTQAPMKLKGADAFRTELTYALEDGLRRKAIIVTAVKSDKLFVVSYFGVKLHYFGKYKDDVERLFTTIEVL